MAATGPYLNIQETADEWGVSLRTVGALIASGELPHRRIGPGRGRVVTSAEDREEYLDAHREGSAGSASAVARVLAQWEAQGLPTTIEDPTVLARVAAVLREHSSERGDLREAS